MGRHTIEYRLDALFDDGESCFDDGYIGREWRQEFDNLVVRPSRFN